MDTASTEKNRNLYINAVYRREEIKLDHDFSKGERSVRTKKAFRKDTEGFKKGSWFIWSFFLLRCRRLLRILVAVVHIAPCTAHVQKRIYIRLANSSFAFFSFRLY